MNATIANAILLESLQALMDISDANIENALPALLKGRGVLLKVAANAHVDFSARLKAGILLVRLEEALQ